jgi:sporulation protein YlmC with PRC-barrel domain
VEFDDVRAIRDDAVIATVDLRRASRVAVNRPIQGKMVISGSGRYVGTIRDIYFDENTGDVCGYEVSPSAGSAATALLPARVPIMGDVLVVEDEANE